MFVKSVAYITGTLIASGSGDTNIKIWDYNAGTLQRTLSGHQDFVQVVIYLELTYIASGSSDRTIKIWDYSNGNLIRTLNGHSSDVRSLSFITGTKFLISGSDDYTIKIWDYTQSTNYLQNTLTGHLDYVYTVKWISTINFISGSNDFVDLGVAGINHFECIKVWNLCPTPCGTCSTMSSTTAPLACT